ncbi:MAG: uracil-DNA glycosylase [Gammaproteobacteria bacterium]
MNDKRLEYLDAMGIQAWERRAPVAAPEIDGRGELEAHPSTPPLKKGGRGDLGRGDSWNELQAQAMACTACALHNGRTQAVFGVGSHQAQWMIVGEAPGADEDRQGEPFVGRAGKLLNAMLFAIGLKREEVYIANVVKCRPPNNRDPLPEEAAACETYLNRQIALLQPKVILVVGRIAAHNLLKTGDTLGSLRGKRYSYADTGIPVVVTYHPAYLLRSPREKRKAWEDLQFARRVFSGHP